MKNQYYKKIKSKNKYREFIKVLNGVLQLSDREADVLSLLVQLDTEWPAGFVNAKNILSTDSRKTIMKETNVNKNNLSKYLAVFKDKNIIVDNGDDTYAVNKIFIPKLIGDDLIEIKFILDYGENN